MHACVREGERKGGLDGWMEGGRVGRREGWREGDYRKPNANPHTTSLTYIERVVKPSGREGREG